MINNSFSDIERFVESNRDNIIRDIGRLVSVNSVEGKPEENAPFGAGPAKALSVAFEICHELGLKTRSCENMIGYAQVGGDSDRYLATVTHLDVVPTGDGWSADPFIMRQKDGYIIGRGVMDDKGPSILCLYALKYLQDNCPGLRYPVRALLGINEETGMNDVLYYLKNYPAPLFCFSPDADFPVCNGEKGITGGVIRSRMKFDSIENIKGGFATNAVCDKAEAWVKAEKLSDAERVTAMKEGGLWHLTASGIGGHASMPEGTVNAIGVLVQYLLDNGVYTNEEENYLRFVSLLHKAYDGSALGVDARDDVFKPLTIIGGTIYMEDGIICQTYDSRYPTTTSGRKICSIMAEKAGDAAEVIMRGDTVPFYVDAENPAVQVCINSYNDVTGENAKPFTIGGGTYARDFPNAVSFGPEHSDRPMPDFAGPIHGIDEAASIEYFMEALKIYILALLRLEELDY